METGSYDSAAATSIAPWLSVSDGSAAVDFYVAAFGATVLEQLKDEAGRVVVAQLTLGEARFWLQWDNDSAPTTLRGISIRLIVTVNDPDVVFARALAHGATEIAAMHNARGWRTGRLSDPLGHQWEFAKRLS